MICFAGLPFLYLPLKGTAIWKEINSFFREREKEKAELIEQNSKEKCQRERETVWGRNGERKLRRGRGERERGYIQSISQIWAS